MSSSARVAGDAGVRQSAWRAHDRVSRETLWRWPCAVVTQPLCAYTSGYDQTLYLVSGLRRAAVALRGAAGGGAAAAAGRALWRTMPGREGTTRWGRSAVKAPSNSLPTSPAPVPPSLHHTTLLFTTTSPPIRPGRQQRVEPETSAGRSKARPLCACHQPRGRVRFGARACVGCMGDSDGGEPRLLLLALSRSETRPAEGKCVNGRDRGVSLTQSLSL